MTAEATYDYLSASPRILGFVVFVFGPLVAWRLVGLYYNDFEPRWGNSYPYQYTYQYGYDYGYNYGYNNELRGWGLNVEPVKEYLSHWSPPWPQYDKGIPGWYQQGLVEVRENRQVIEMLTRGQDTGIILAAALFNQGNSGQRPFGWEGLERVQVWLGQHLEWRLSHWDWARTRWIAWFEQYSVGIGQITPAEVKRLGFQLGQVDLFDDSTSVTLMYTKLNQTYQQAIQLGLNRTDALILMMVSNNNEFDTIENFRMFDENIHLFLARSPYAQRQLTRMMTYIHHLNVHEYWPLPAGVDWDYLCRLANTSWE
jgi:hypothetical protein